MGQQREFRRTRLSRAACVLAGSIALAGGAAWASAAGAATHVQAMDFKGAHVAASSSGGNLVDHGGRITPTSHTYTVFWGAQSAWPSDVVTGIGNLFGGFNGSGYLGIAGQYMRNAALSSTYEGAKFDPSNPPRKVSPSTLGSEVAKVYGSSPDPDGIYFVYTSNFPSGGGFCAWHSFASVNGQKVAVAYMPNTNGVAGCNGGNQYGSSSYSEALYSLANVSSHEFMEAVTDTWPANGSYGWIDGSGSEIGDKCAWQFAGPVKLSNNTQWQLQEEWSNAITGCAQG